MFDYPHPHPVPLQQHPNFAAALRRIGRAPQRIPGPPDMLMMKRRLPGGLHLGMLSRVMLEDTSLDDMAERLRSWRAPAIIGPDHPTPGLARIGAVPLMSPATVAEIDLCAGRDELRARMHQKWRNRLVHAERQDLRITACGLGPANGDWLFSAEEGQRRAKGYRGWPEELTRAWAEATPGATRLLTAFQGATPVAGMLFLLHGEAATYHVGYTTPLGRATSAHNLLLWQAMCWLSARGYLRLDLGTLDTLRAPGLARFKLGAGAGARPLGGTWAWWPVLGRALAPLAWLDRRLMTA